MSIVRTVVRNSQSCKAVVFAWRVLLEFSALKFG